MNRLLLFSYLFIFVGEVSAYVLNNSKRIGQYSIVRRNNEYSHQNPVLSSIYLTNRDSYQSCNVNIPTVLKVIPENKQIDENLSTNEITEYSLPKSSLLSSESKLSIIITMFVLFSFLFLPYSASYALPFESSRHLISDNWSRYFLAGGICCAISHTVSIPFDVVKTKKQASKELGDLGVFNAFQKIIKDDGLSVLSKGFGPTLIGYFIQGALKYGFYEIFKPIVALLLHSYGGVLGDNLIIGLMISGIMADFIGSLSLSPFEAARIRLVANPEFSSNLFDCILKMVRVGGIGSLFSSFPMMLSKHLPYTAVQLSSYETITSAIYHQLDVLGIVNLESYHYGVSLIAATISAILSCLASQPGDTLMTVINKQTKVVSSSTSSTTLISSISSGMNEIAQSQSQPSKSMISLMISTSRELGWKGLYVGTAARLIHIGIIVVVQLLVYDYIKQLCGLPITGFSH